MRNIYKAVNDAGFEFTGEVRQVQPGEYYLSASGIPEINCFEQASTGLPPLILRKIKRTFEFDGQTFECPKGYVFERVGLVRETDIGKYVLDAPDSRFGPELVDPKHWQSRDCIYAIFRKESK